MPSPSLGIAGYLLITIVLFSSSLTAATTYHGFANLTFENRNLSTGSDVLSKQLLANYSRWQYRRKKCGINIDDFSNMTSRTLILGTTPPEIDITARPGDYISTINSSSISPSEGIPILLTDQPVLPVPTLSEPTGSTAPVLAGKFSGILDRVIPLTAPKIDNRTDSREQATRQVIATGFARGGYQVETSQQKAPNSLYTMASLFGDINSITESVVQEIAIDPTDDLSASNVRRRSEIVSSSLDSITNTVINSITSDTPATTNSQLSLTTPILPRLDIILETVTTHADRMVTVIEDCHSKLTETIFLAGRIHTLTVYANQPCPPNPPCPDCVSPTCHCPNAGGAGSPTITTTTTTSLSGIPGARGPCPSSGYTCHECLDGWFCPPLQTPAQPAPCGFGWPCAHCDGGWFCVPQPTLGPETCAGSSGPATNGPGTMSSTVSLSRNPSQSSPTQPTESGPTMLSPKSPREASGWGYCGCWADQADNRVLNMEPYLNLGPLTNEGCVQHCIGHGFLMAGTENGDSCYCGNFLNGTQKLDDSKCSVSCTGDSEQACGGNDALSCYSSDNQAHGWASAGPQPLPATAKPPEVISMNVGGVAQTVVTGPAVVFPPPDADMSQLVSQFGHKTRQPQGELPNNMGSNSAIPTSANGGSTPGASATPPNGGGGVTSGRCTEEPGSFPSGSSAAGPTSPRGNGGNGNSPPNNSGTTPGPGNGGASSNTNGDLGPSPTTPRNSLTVSPNGNSGASPSSATNKAGSGSFGQGGRPNSASNDGTSGGSAFGSSLNTSPNNGGDMNPTGSGHGSPSDGSMPSQNGGLGSASSSGNGGTSLVTPGENPSSPVSPSAGSNSGVSATSPNGQSQGATTPSPNSNQPSDNSHSGQTPSQNHESADSSPTDTSPRSGSNQGQTSPSQAEGTIHQSSNGGTPAQTSTGEVQGSPSPSPTANSFGSNSNPGQTSPSQGNESAAPGPSSNPSNNGGISGVCTQGSNDPACRSFVGGDNGGSATPHTSQASASSNGNSGAGSNPQTNDNPSSSILNNGGRATLGDQGQSTISSPNSGSNGNSPDNNGNSNLGGTPNTSKNGGIGNGTPSTVGFSPTSNPWANEGGGSNTQLGQGMRSTGNGGNENSNPVSSGSNPTFNPSTNGGPMPNGQGLGTQSSPNTGGSSVLTAPGSNANPAPTGTNGGEAQPTTSVPNVGGVGSSPEVANTQTSSFTLPPGAVPYGGLRPPSMTTLASMIAWTEPDGEKGPNTMIQDDMRNHGEPPSTFEVEEVPTTITSITTIINTVTITSTSTSVDPRWQRIRPVWIW